MSHLCVNGNRRGCISLQWVYHSGQTSVHCPILWDIPQQFMTDKSWLTWYFMPFNYLKKWKQIKNLTLFPSLVGCFELLANCWRHHLLYDCRMFLLNPRCSLIVESFQMLHFLIVTGSLPLLLQKLLWWKSMPNISLVDNDFVWHISFFYFLLLSLHFLCWKNYFRIFCW